MKRIKPTHFIEGWRGRVSKLDYSPPIMIECLNNCINNTDSKAHLKTICVFLIKEQTTTLAKRLSARGINQTT